MKSLLGAISINQAFLVTAPPGWGKTYKTLSALKKLNIKIVFIFPLRALCDEVYLSAIEMGINAINLRSPRDWEVIQQGDFKLTLCTPELFPGGEFFKDTIFVLDEFHLFYYWGESFRNQLLEVYFEIASGSQPLILLTATASRKILEKTSRDLAFNYQEIIHINIANQKLKNSPDKIIYYPKYFKKWMVDDYLYNLQNGCSLIFCQYREEVHLLGKALKAKGFNVLTCVGGEAKEFVQGLMSTKDVQFIVATSVISHGVNLPQIKKIYLTYNVDKIDFYIQMVGRGGRDGSKFELHTRNNNYFNKREMIRAFLNLFLNRFLNYFKKKLAEIYDT